MFIKYTPVIGALLIYVILGALLCIRTPLWIPPDEELHVAYCQYMARNKTPPRTGIGAQQETVVMAFHPPLYYAAGAFFFRSDDTPVENVVRIHDGPGYALLTGGTENRDFTGRLFLLRLFTLLFGAVVIAATYAAGRLLFPHTSLPAAVAAFFIATNPQFLHVSAGIANETPAAAFSTLVILSLLAYCRGTRSSRAMTVLGVLLGCSLLTKTSTVFLVPLCVLIIALVRRLSITYVIRDLTIVLGTAGLASGWWYVLNWKSLSRLQTFQPWFNRTVPISFEYIQGILTNGFMSFFGFFGSQQIALPSPYFFLYALIVAGGVCGLTKKAFTGQYDLNRAIAVLTLIMACIGGVAVFLLLNYTYHAPQGKYLYTAIMPIALLTAWGFLNLFGSRWKTTAAAALILVMVTTGALAILTVLMPSIREPRLRQIASQPDFNCITEHITDTHMIIHTFNAPEDNLCGIRVLFSKTCATDTGALIVRLVRQSPTEAQVFSTLVPMREIRDSHWHYFSFAPVPDSAGKNFSIHFETHGLHHDAQLALWCNQDTAAMHSHDGSASLCKPCFEAYAFTGSVPKTVWEGRETRVTRQQLYVSVREMQLFAQTIPGSANREYISRKWRRLEYAAINRQQWCAALHGTMH